MNFSALAASACDGCKIDPVEKSSSMHVTDSTESGLLVPTTPLGPRLIQPEVYRPMIGCLRLRIDHAAALVEDDAPAIVKGHIRQRHAAIADRAEHQPRLDLFKLIGGLGAERSGFRRDQRVVHQLHAA